MPDTKVYSRFPGYVADSVKDKGQQSPMSIFTRGLQSPGQQWKFSFPNGYSASVINDGYGAERGLYELAVLRDGSIVYDTPVTNDVLGYLTEAAVAEALDAIAALPEAVS